MALTGDAIITRRLSVYEETESLAIFDAGAAVVVGHGPHVLQDI